MSVFAPVLSKHHRLALLAATLVFAADQGTKAWILALLESIPMREVTPFFNLYLAWNKGISFSLFTNTADYGPYVLSAVSLAIVGVLVFWLRQVHKPYLAAAIGLIMGGAFGNIIDRLRFGAVTDFLDFHAFGYHWPAFNIADSAICIGVMILLADNLFGKKETP